MKNIIYILLLFIVPCAFAGRDIELPFSLNMDTYNYSDLVWAQESHFVHLASGCWSGGCAKFYPPNTDSDNVSSLGQFTGFSESQVNIRFLMKVGTSWVSTARAGAEGFGDKLVILNPASGQRPMIFLSRYNDGAPFNYAPCLGDGIGNIVCQCGGVSPCYWPNGNDAMEYNNGLTGDYAGK